MSSIIKVNTYQDANGNALFSSDGSGNVTTSATGLQNTPSFLARLSSLTTISGNTDTKAQCDTVLYDIGGYYDNTTNYRYTPQVAGKYYVYGQVYSDQSLQSQMHFVSSAIWKNGSRFGLSIIDFRGNYGGYNTAPHFSCVIDMNGTTDYIELYGRLQIQGGTPQFNATGSELRTFFGAYRIIGA